MLIVLAGACFACASGRSVSPVSPRAESLPLEIGAGPTDLHDVLRTPEGAAVSLRGSIMGQSVLLSCPCLERPLSIAAPKGRFSVSGLPVGDYTAEVRGSSSERVVCRGSVDSSRRMLLLHGFLVGEQWIETIPPTPPSSRVDQAQVSFPCQLLAVPDAEAESPGSSLEELWRSAVP
ncbi:hypothetical protein [Nannocystis radixulma]|uniref:Carboxypeptidase regulatory-like domain-containing protein n=1 Tax=Nannocystis radixulma TaxID=2995305 RepID=A0ABT5AX90_9BACT|nr:hypothetical protein [Nannocystis radixulma]MDC0666467.1 hypothetical protein [Nannocystis radixulma]